MPDLNKIKERIAEIAGRRNNVTLSEIEWVVSQLGLHGYMTGDRKAKHGKLFTVGSQRFGVCCHNPGSNKVKACYVDAFLDAMIELGIYEE